VTQYLVLAQVKNKWDITGLDTQLRIKLPAAIVQATHLRPRFEGDTVIYQQCAISFVIEAPEYDAAVEIASALLERRHWTIDLQIKELKIVALTTI
jgi:hypothetical protein